MYGKWFKSAYTGSMYGAGEHVFAVWSWVVANAGPSGVVEINPRALADSIGSTPERMQAALEYLTGEDSDSRTKAEGGRRLLHEGGYQYRIVNHGVYRSLRDEQERRDYNRTKMQESRARKRQTQDAKVKRGQTQSQTSVPPCAYTEAEAELEADPNTEAVAAVGCARTPVASDMPEPDATTAATATTADLSKQVEAGTVDPLAAAILQTLRSDRRAVELGIAELPYAEQLLGVVALAPYPLTAATAGEAICDALADLPAGANEQFARKMVRSYLKQQAKKPPGEHAHRSQDTDVASALGIKSSRSTSKQYAAPYHRPFEADE